MASADIEALCESHRELVGTGTEFLDAMSLGPLGAAARYGPDFDLRQYEVKTAADFNAALARARKLLEAT